MFWRKSKNGYKEVFFEDSLLKQVDTVPLSVPDWESRKYYPNVLLGYPEENRTLQLIGTLGKREIKVEVLGKQNSECEPYVFYPITPEDPDTNNLPLIASPYDLEIEYGNWPEIDTMVQQDPYLNCIDCLHSFDKEKTFARLKGSDNVFFLYQGPMENTEEAYTPSRSLIYVNAYNEVIVLWSDSIDLFGCSCL